MAYCTTADLLLGQLTNRLPPEINADEYIQAAADHIDARLGFQYVTPFDIEDDGSLPENQVKLLKGINAKRASGQIILAATIATEDNSIHQYGLWLLQESDLELQAIQSGSVKLSAPWIDAEGNEIGPTEDPNLADPYARIPTSGNVDAYSANAAFEANIMQGYPVGWTPRDGSRFITVPPAYYPRGQ